MVSCAGVTPLVGETVSQLPPLAVVAAAVKGVPVPDEVTEAVCAEGEVCPDMAVKLRVDGLIESVCGASTVSETGIVIGLPVAPAEAMVTVPLYVAGVIPLAFTVTETLPGVLPLAGETDSQLPLVVVAVAVKFKDPGVPVTEMVCAAGADPPCTWEKVRLAGVAEMVPGLTVKVTGTVTLLEEPAAVMVMVP
jgi:hypothetical protein